MNSLLLSGPPGRQYGIPHLPGVHSFDCCQEEESEAPRSTSGSNLGLSPVRFTLVWLPAVRGGRRKSKSPTPMRSPPRPRQDEN